MLKFKQEALERLLTHHHKKLSLPTRQQIQRLVDQGAERLNPYAFSKLCRDLECLPTDILRAV